MAEKKKVEEMKYYGVFVGAEAPAVLLDMLAQWDSHEYEIVSARDIVAAHNRVANEDVNDNPDHPWRRGDLFILGPDGHEGWMFVREDMMGILKGKRLE